MTTTRTPPVAADTDAPDPPARLRTDRVSLAAAGRRAWQFVGIAIALILLARLVAVLHVVVVAVLLALLATATLSPLMTRLVRTGLPRSAAALTLVGSGVGVIVGLLWAVGLQVAEQVPALLDQVEQAVRQLSTRFPSLPVPEDGSITGLLQRGGDGTGLAASGLRVGAELLSGIALAVVLSFFLLRDGAAMWRWATSALTVERRALADRMGGAAFGTVARYVRGLSVVAAADAALAGIALFALGVPLAAVLTVLTFMAAFIPTVGAFVVGGLAVALAFTEGGTTMALIVLAVYTGVQQLDGNVLQPWIMGHELPLHPAAVLVALAVGGILAGVLGALLGVPVAAAVVAAARELLVDEPADEPA